MFSSVYGIHTRKHICLNRHLTVYILIHPLAVVLLSEHYKCLMMMMMLMIMMTMTLNKICVQFVINVAWRN